MSNFYISEILHYQPATLDIEQVSELVSDYLSEIHQIKQTQIRYFNQANENFSIDQVREMQWESQHAVDFAHSDNKRAFVLINFTSAQTAAQNAALKLIEESPANTLLLIPVSDPHLLLPTIISRCKMISRQAKQQTTREEARQSLPKISYPTSYSMSIELAAQYKDRAAASKYLLELINQTQNTDWQSKEILLKSYQSLEANANVLLTLEQCFFSLVSLEKQPLK